MSELKPGITGKHSEKRKNTQPTGKENSTVQKYKRSGGPVFTFSLPGIGASHPCPTSVAPLVASLLGSVLEGSTLVYDGSPDLFFQKGHTFSKNGQQNC